MFGPCFVEQLFVSILVLQAEEDRGCYLILIMFCCRVSISTCVFHAVQLVGLGSVIVAFTSNFNLRFYILYISCGYIPVFSFFAYMPAYCLHYFFI